MAGTSVPHTRNPIETNEQEVAGDEIKPLNVRSDFEI
jgi:hypothetical protein